MQPLIRVVLAADPQGGSPATFYPRALVLAETDGQLAVHHVYEEDRHAVGSRKEANGIILPIVQRWLRNKGWRRYEIFFPGGRA